MMEGAERGESHVHVRRRRALAGAWEEMEVEVGSCECRDGDF